MLLAPYQPAMRLGMGFNTFTQELCTNDAVLPEISASDDGATVPSMSSKAIDTSASIRPKYQADFTTLADGTENVTQQVTWSAKFVEKVSDVTDSLNISGHLEIKCDALGGGAQGSGSFIDSKKMKESDINYFVQVKVVNHVYRQDNITRFNKIKNVKDEEFTSYYGDAFISGFIEGGEFNALISVKLKDSSKIQQIKGALEVSMNFPAAQVTAKAEGEMVKAMTDSGSETTINVSWSGGGDIKGKDVKEWNLQGLKTVAMEFPEHVLACPITTNAILTKYETLKSFRESKPFSPINYDLAGSYASSLLDAYLDYKIMWRNLQDWMRQLEAGDLQFQSKPMTAAMQNYKKTFEDYHEAQKKNTSPLPDVTSSGTGTVAVTASRDSLTSTALKALNYPPIVIAPYGTDMFSLDDAKKQCRIEMIKIVREVDAVAEDPSMALDLNREYCFLSPMVFRMLLPEITHSTSGELHPSEVEPALSILWKQVGEYDHTDPSKTFELILTDGTDKKIILHDFGNASAERCTVVSRGALSDVDLKTHGRWTWDKPSKEEGFNADIAYLQTDISQLTDAEKSALGGDLVGSKYLCLRRNSIPTLVASKNDASKLFFVQHRIHQDHFSLRLWDDALCALTSVGSNLRAVVLANFSSSQNDQYNWIQNKVAVAADN